MRRTLLVANHAEETTSFRDTAVHEVTEPPLENRESRTHHTFPHSRSFYDGLTLQTKSKKGKNLLRNQREQTTTEAERVQLLPYFYLVTSKQILAHTLNLSCHRTYTKSEGKISHPSAAFLSPHR